MIDAETRKKLRDEAMEQLKRMRTAERLAFVGVKEATADLLESARIQRDALDIHKTATEGLRQAEADVRHHDAELNLIERNKRLGLSE